MKERMLNRAMLLMAGVLAVLMIGCGQHKSEPKLAVSGSDASKSSTNAETRGSPNSAVLEWDAVNDPRLRGYRIYYGPELGAYLQLRGQGIDAGNVTTYTVTGLVSQRRYYFAVTAYDSSNRESRYSNEVSKDVP